MQKIGDGHKIVCRMKPVQFPSASPPPLACFSLQFQWHDLHESDKMIVLISDNLRECPKNNSEVSRLTILPTNTAPSLRLRLKFLRGKTAASELESILQSRATWRAHLNWRTD